MPSENKENTNKSAGQSVPSAATDNDRAKGTRPTAVVVKWRDRFKNLAVTPRRREMLEVAEEQHLPVSTTEDELFEFEMHAEARGDFKIRPISKQWRYVGKRPAYRTSVANVAYIWRDPEPQDEFGTMPASFGQRSYELRACGLLLPRKAPKWASDGYSIWSEADANATATGDPTMASAWHVCGEIPTTVPAEYWEWLVTGFVERELSNKGAAVAWSIHALEGDDGNWIVRPHFHLVVSQLYWRHRATKFGKRHPCWLSNRRAHNRLEAAWHRRCGAARMTRRSGSGRRIPWMAP